jgi:hypothetical protein
MISELTGVNFIMCQFFRVNLKLSGLKSPGIRKAVQGDETDRVPQYIINGSEFTSIDFGTDYNSVLALATVSREAFVVRKQICLV